MDSAKLGAVLLLSLNLLMPGLSPANANEPAQPLPLSAAHSYSLPDHHLASQNDRPAVPHQVSEIVFLDSGISDRNVLSESIFHNNDSKSIQVVPLNPHADAIEQITSILSAHHNLKAIHILSHGSAGDIHFGNQALNIQTVEQHEKSLRAWGEALSASGDILIYGCSVALGKHGRQLIERISDLTKADVAASTDLTGHWVAGGDWELEATAGVSAIETSLVLNSASAAAYTETLDIDTDGDLVLNQIDLDDDNDGILDSDEGYELLPSNAISGKVFFGLVFTPKLGVPNEQAVNISGIAGTKVTVDGQLYTIGVTGLLTVEVTKQHATPGISDNSVVSVEADADISMTAVLVHEASADGWVVLPVHALGKNYTIIGHATASGVSSQITVAAVNENTSVQIFNPTGVQVESFILDVGESYLYVEDSSVDLTGYTVMASRDVSVGSGLNCLDSGQGACDFELEQLFPDEDLDLEYFIPDLSQNFKTRVVVTVTGTEIFVDGTSQGTFNKGQFFEVAGAGLHIEASHPVTAYLVVEGELNSGSSSDPSFILLPGNASAVLSTTFSAPSSQYSNELIIVAPSVNADLVELDGAVVGGLWTPFADDVTKSYRVIPISAGVHSVVSTSAFIPLVNGYVADGSYGFVAGMGSALLGASVETIIEATVDTDLDTVPNHLDLDSDNDGIPDNVEAQLTSGYLPPNNDGPVTYVLNFGVNSAWPGGLTPLNSDSTDAADFLDTDSDNDGIDDSQEGLLDSDENGTPNYLDLDSDGDTIPDSIEGAADTDGDGIANFLDLDGDNDLLSDSIEGSSDSDVDGVANFLDPDSDDDGIPDIDEGLKDTDGDGTPDHLDKDSDNDGLIDQSEGVLDNDSDGTPDYLDSDSDQDGISDALEGASDVDEDSTPNYLDSDSDGDQIPDSIEAGISNGLPADLDGDTVFDFLDIDTDNDGISDATEGSTDADTDGIANYRDLDSDNDGIFDIIEARSTLSVVGDADLNGMIDIVNNFGANGMADKLETEPDSGIENSDLADADGDGILDMHDLDSDNDGLSDLVEAGGSDVDGDAQVDNFVDANGDGVDDGLAVLPLPLPDTDRDKVKDFRDLDSDNDSLSDVIETQGLEADRNTDGRIDDFIDNDSDGLADRVALAAVFLSDLDNDGIWGHQDLDSDGDGVMDLVEAGGVDADGDGMDDGYADSDSDGIPDSIDADATGGSDVDGDGIDDSVQTRYFDEGDLDGDGIIDSRDLDANGDGVADAQHGGPELLSALPDPANNGTTDVQQIDGSVEMGLNGGGCTVGSGTAEKDPVLPLMLVFAVLWLFLRALARESGRVWVVPESRLNRDWVATESRLNRVWVASGSRLGGAWVANTFGAFCAMTGAR